jgi:hypothetical protein
MDDTTDTHPLAERIATSISERADGKSSRRTFLNRSAVAGGTLLALTGGTAAAQETADEAEPPTGTFDDVSGTDTDVLNYALTLEHLENAFYATGLEMFSESDFVAAESLEQYPSEYISDLYHYVETIGSHETEHVDVLTQSVELLGGEPATAGSYEFGFETVDEFLPIGQALENTGVAAYAGAAPYIESPDLLSAALSIHSVEARHAAVLNEVTDTSPAPNAFDPAQSQSDVLDIASQFIVGEPPAETPTENGTGTPTENGTGTPVDNGTTTPTANGTENETVIGSITDALTDTL